MARVVCGSGCFGVVCGELGCLFREEGGRQSGKWA